MYDFMISIAERPCRPFSDACCAPHCIFLVLAVAAIACPVAFGVDQPMFRKTLRDLPGVGVLVEHLRPEVEQAGLTQRQVQTEVEQRLREHGIKVLTQPEFLRTFGRPLLAVSIQSTSAEHDSKELYGVHIIVALKQRVLLERNTTIPAVEAATWEVSAHRMVGRDAFQLVQEDVAQLVDRFIQAYRSVNREPGSRTESSRARRLSSRGSLIHQAQERLTEKGFDPGPITGQMGAKTQDALRQFQQSQGLTPSGELDEPTHRALGIK
jgi:Putative peptidoglycan binding domain